MFNYPLVKPFKKSFVKGFFNKNSSAMPPVLDKLLVWLNGSVKDSLRVDSYKTPGDFPMDLKQSFCLNADGTTDSGVTSIAHGTLVSYGGTSTVTYSGTSLSMTAGTLWRLEFSDGTIYPLAEGSGATCFSTDGLHSIALTSGNLTALRSGRQDEYHHNVAGGWWEKSGDSVKYPYDVAGFTEYHKPNTWNGAETKQSFKQTQVATFDGVGDYISLNSSITLSGDFKISIYCGHDLPNIRGFLIKQASSSAYVIDDPVYSMYIVKVGGVYIEFHSIYQSNNRQPGVLEIVRVGSNLTISINGFSETKSTGLLDTEFNLISSSSDPYSGKMFSVTFEDSSSKTIIPLNEGSGLDIHDSQGNIVGTVTSGNLTDFWANKVTPQALLDMDAPYDFFLDSATGEPVPRPDYELKGKLSDGTDDPTTPINTSKQYYFCESLLCYDSVLSDSEDIEVKDYLSCWDVSYVTDSDGNRLVDSSGNFLTTITEV